VKEFVDASPDGSGIPVRLAITDKSFNRDVYNIYPGFSCKVILSIDNETGKGYTVPLSAVFKDLKTDETSVWLYHTDGQKTKSHYRAIVGDRSCFGDRRIGSRRYYRGCRSELYR
jgi:hypothetical protein